MTLRRRLLAGMSSFVLALAAGAAQAAWPERPITLIVPWGAGGGTDATARIIASLLEKDLGQPINVVNRTGGSGVVGHQAIASAAPDGYTIGIITVEIGMMHWQPSPRRWCWFCPKTAPPSAKRPKRQVANCAQPDITPRPSSRRYRPTTPLNWPTTA